MPIYLYLLQKVAFVIHWLVTKFFKRLWLHAAFSQNLKKVHLDPLYYAKPQSFPCFT